MCTINHNFTVKKSFLAFCAELQNNIFNYLKHMFSFSREYSIFTYFLKMQIYYSINVINETKEGIIIFEKTQKIISFSAFF